MSAVADARPSSRRGPVRLIGRVFDIAEAWWVSAATQRRIGSLLVAVFVLALAGVEASAAGWLPQPVAAALPSTHFGAIAVVFGLLLVFEVVALLLALAKSVADSVAKQFELLALILMREAFLAFTEHSEPLDWSRISPVVPDVLAEMAGALAIFALLVLYRRVQRHRAITEDQRGRDAFIAAKKVVSVALLVMFVIVGVEELIAAGAGPAAVRSIFSRFYTLLVLSDVLIVLLSLRYTSVFRVVFRNAGFAAAAAMARLALSAPPWANAALATIAMLFALGLSVAHNAWADAERRESAVVPS